MSAAIQNGLAGMAARLTDPGDREAYAAVLSYVDSLPETDELVRVVRLVGLVALLAQHIPDAMAEFLETFRQERKDALAYHSLVGELMARLPEEIAASVDPAAIGKAMGETFRQQIANSGVAEAVKLLQQSLNEVQTVSGKLGATLRPLSEEYSRIGSMVSGELARLTTASREMQQQNAAVVRQRRTEWTWELLFALVLVLGGFVSGIWWEQGKTAVALGSMAAQIERIQTRMPAAAPVVPKGRRR